MEHKRDEIINELDVQIKYAKFTNTNGVLLSAKAAQFCLELAQFYEQKIKELTEEVASWKEIAEGYQKQFEDCAEDRAKLTEDEEKWREMWADNQSKWEKAYAELEAENAEQDEAINRALKQMGEVRRETKADTVKEVYRWLEGKNIANAGMLWRLCKDFKKQFGLEGDDEES